MSDLSDTVRRQRFYLLEASLFFVDWLGKPLWMWAGFLGLVIAILSFDLAASSSRWRPLASVGVAGASVWIEEWRGLTVRFVHDDVIFK